MVLLFCLVKNVEGCVLDIIIFFVKELYFIVYIVQLYIFVIYMLIVRWNEKNLVYILILFEIKYKVYIMVS